MEQMRLDILLLQKWWTMKLWWFSKGGRKSMMTSNLLYILHFERQEASGRGHIDIDEWPQFWGQRFLEKGHDTPLEQMLMYFENLGKVPCWKSSQPEFVLEYPYSILQPWCLRVAPCSTLFRFVWDVHPHGETNGGLVLDLCIWRLPLWGICHRGNGDVLLKICFSGVHLFPHWPSGAVCAGSELLLELQVTGTSASVAKSMAGVAPQGWFVCYRFRIMWHWHYASNSSIIHMGV